MRRPAFALTAVLTLALSLGAATLLFSVTEGVLLRPLPFPESDRIVNLYLMNEEWRDSENALFQSIWDSHPVYADHVEAWRQNPVGLETVGSFAEMTGTVELGDASLDGVDGLQVDPGFFSTVGIAPLVGRLPSLEEFESRESVAVIGETVWRDLFGRDPGVVGRTYGFGEKVYTVVGVLPAEFPFPTDSQWSFWTPFDTDGELYVRYGVGRLGEGVSVATASEGLDAVARRLGEENPEHRRFGAQAMLFLDDVVSGVRTQILFLLVTGLAVLAVACVNLANLILVRGAARRSELAVRTALGASRGSLLGSVFVEVGLVCVVGGCAGVALAFLALEPFVSGLAATVGGLPREDEISLNGVVLLFATGATLASALIAGLVPAMRGTRHSPALALAEGHRGVGAGRSGRRTQLGLLLTQCGITAVLLIGTGLLVRGALHAALLDPGYDAEGVVHVSARLERGERVDRVAQSTALESARSRLASLPGVTGAALASSLPVIGGATLLDFRTTEGDDAPSQSVVTTTVSPQYFETLGIQLLTGRLPERTPINAEQPRPLVLAEGAAAALFGTEDPVGRKTYSPDGREFEVVALVRDSRFWVTRRPFLQAYRIGGQGGMGFASFAVRTTRDPAELAELGRAIISQEVRDGEVVTSGHLADDLASSTTHLRARAILMLTLGLVAALLTMVGIAGVVGHFLAEQTRDVAVRMALGAQAEKETRRIVGVVLGPALTGLLLGVAAAIWLSRLAEDVLFEIPARDPIAYLGASVLVLLLAGFAAWLPARRTTTIAPAEVLNSG